ncbi:MAG TPA: gamma-glutamyl-gamma-aminobutyrate hydrolase family protein [Candidatus Saccharimonadales bacterium]|nr:gamma-glutamyl-gamma-aminobutyrate hydrolase family protein [Candidatus Saccharimonadales bacterium]
MPENKNDQKPLIGVTMCMDKDGFIREGIDYSYIRRDYGEALRAAGANAVYLEPSIDPVAAAELCDGIIISGGEDIHPSFYGQEINGAKKLEPVERTSWEHELINACDEVGKPILGICYGQQLLNVHYGGTLHQDLTGQADKMDHGSSVAAAIHEVSFIEDGLGFNKGERAASASRHHQAVCDLAPGFTAVAVAADGIIEAIKGCGHFGIQWHPESDGTAERVYGAFVARCAGLAKITVSGILESTGRGTM